MAFSQSKVKRIEADCGGVLPEEEPAHLTCFWGKQGAPYHVPQGCAIGRPQQMTLSFFTHQ